MARSQGAKYDVRTDQYVFPDGTRVDASGVTSTPQQYYTNTTTNNTNPWATAGVDMSVMVPKDKYARITAEDLENAKKDAIKEIVEKIKTKYEGRDLLMIKTADLIREIEKL